MTNQAHGPIKVSAEVQEAISTGAPVLALESTILTHGLPRPQNQELAFRAEQIVRDAGAVPATIGVVQGALTVGLSREEIIELSNDDTAVKASLRDLPVVVAQQLNAGTTVAATGFLAAKVGVRAFSTGGLGGVHHGAETSFDESADLPTLAGLPLVVVSAGVKSILNIELTLERFETLSLTVVGYGSDHYPGFFVNDSGFTIEHVANSPEEVAAIALARDSLGIESTVLVANPVPATDELDPEVHERVLASAWAAAERDGISGHDTTPYLLQYITDATQGESLRANLAAYYNNVAVGAEVAKAIAASLRSE